MKRKELEIEGYGVPVTAVNTVIVGAGAAGMNAAVRLVEFWRERGVEAPQRRLRVVTGGRKLGTSRMSGSDKQTYYKMGTSPDVPDSAREFAEALTAGGCCHGDTALAEGIASLRSFYHLVDAGVPFPHDPWGSFIGYKTDHDPYERATSAGPKTSKFMAERLEEKAARQGVEIDDGRVVARFLTEGEGAERRITGMLCIDRSRVGEDGAGLCAYVAENWILAAGGPGELYRTTVYPPGQLGIHGAAFEAGLEGANLTESQYGLASVKFRWNVSGTYMQAVPRIFSTDADGGDEREFLTEYFDDMPAMATNIFLKGYQWPFDAQRITGRQSSLVDMAVHQETVVRGRHVWMDFRRNPVGADGWDEFDFAALGQEALEYLRKAGATQPTPIERLEHMNGPAIELYAESEIDLYSEPLEIAVCAQHHNGGFAVDKWWQSNILRTFVVGEMAGTHGVKRPGGSALNAGQVGGLRAVEYIAGVYGAEEPEVSDSATAGLDAAVSWVKELLAAGETAGVTPGEAMDEIKERMTRCGAHLRSGKGAERALDAALEQYARLRDDGLGISEPADLVDAVTALQQCLTHVAFLRAICAMFDRAAGSRGSHCVLDPEGAEMHPKLIDPETDEPYRFLDENEDLRGTILHVSYDPSAPELFRVRDVGARAIPERDVAFEVAWREYREGEIFDL